VAEKPANTPPVMRSIVVSAAVSRGSRSHTGPLGRRRHDIQAATIAATVANASRGKKGKKLKVTDFLLPYGTERKSPEEMLAAIRGINRSMGGVERVAGGRGED
jgi:hypothetical protein